MRQVDFQYLDASYYNFGESSPTEKSQNEHLTVGNLVFESNNSSGISEDEYYNTVLTAKQTALPLSFIQEKKQKGIIEAFYSQKRTNISQTELAQKINNNMSLEQQYVLQNYLIMSQSAACQPASTERSDSGSDSSRGGFSSCQDLETKESAFAYFIEKELGHFSNNTGINGKSQIFSYTIVQCIEDELEPFILRKGMSEALISILGSNRNHYQQMMMRVGTYEALNPEIRRQTNISLLKTHIQCYEAAKYATSSSSSSSSSSSQEIQKSTSLNYTAITPFMSYIQSAIETLEKAILPCAITTSVIPCIHNGILLGFFQYESYSFQAPVIKKLVADRKINRVQVPNFWNEQEYNIKSELFIQKMEDYSH